MVTRETLDEQEDDPPKAQGLWLIDYGKNRRLGDRRVGCLLDGRENCRSGFLVKLMPVKAEKHAFANRLDRGVRNALPQRGFHHGAGGREI